jgi:5-methylcytosine-specific restriction endonuclease McrA
MSIKNRSFSGCVINTARKTGELTDGELFELLLEDFIERNDPVKKAERARKRESKKTPSPQRTRAIPARFRHELALATTRTCQYRDPETGRPCGSRKNLQIDHRQPYSKGGSHKTENLTYLCRSHNLRKGSNASS